MNQFFLQRDDKIWEEVDEYIFKERNRAIGVEGFPRYNGNYIHNLDGNIAIHADDLDLRDMGVIMRYFGIRETDCPRIENGWFQTPTVVKLRASGRGKAVLYEMGSKQMWKAA